MKDLILDLGGRLDVFKSIETKFNLHIKKMVVENLICPRLFLYLSPFNEPIACEYNFGFG